MQNDKWPVVIQVGGQSTHLPLKVNAAGVIPVIFAVSFIVTPRTIASFFEQNDVTLWIQKYLIIHIRLVWCVCCIDYCIYVFLCFYSGESGDKLQIT